MEQENDNLDIEIDKEINKLTEELDLSKNKNDSSNIKEEEILYRLIYLYKIKKNFQQEKYFIELCLKKEIILSEEIWLDYITIKKKEKNLNFDDIINIYLKSLENFIYPKILY